MPKKYSEDEVRELLYSALQLQEKAREREHATSGLTLDEVSEIAEEVGIDPAFIVAAAKKTAEEDALERKKGILGQTKELTMRSTVEGVLTNERIDAIVKRLRKVMGGRGELDRAVNTFRWETEKDDGERLLVTAESDEDSTDIVMTHEPRRIGVGEWIPPLMPLIFPLVILLSRGPLVAVVMFTLFASLMTAMTLSGTRKKVKSNDARDRRKVEGLLSGMESILEPDDRVEVEHAVQLAPNARIEPSLLEDEPDADTEVQRRRDRARAL